ncbi:MAG: hypothetical protein Q9225_003284 [Loekoesia sp. 1 TL-2023]
MVSVESGLLKARMEGEAVAQDYVASSKPMYRSTELVGGNGLRNLCGTISNQAPEARERIADTSHSRRALDTPAPLTRAEKASSGTSIALQPRFPPLANLLGGYRLTWDGFISIQPSIYAAHAFVTLFSSLANIVRDKWSQKPPLGRFQVKYGSLKVSCESEDQVMPWAVVMDLVRELQHAAEQRFLGFYKLRLTRRKVNEIAMTFAITLVGTMVVRAGLPDAEGGDRFLTNIIG